MKNYWKRTKHDSSDSLSSNSDLSDKSDYKIKIHNKKKSYHKRGPIKLYTKLMEIFLTTAFRSKIIKFKLDEDLIQIWIYFITFM